MFGGVIWVNNVTFTSEIYTSNTLWIFDMVCLAINLFIGFGIVIIVVVVIVDIIFNMNFFWYSLFAFARLIFGF